MNLLQWYKARKKRKAHKDLAETIRAAIHYDRDILTPEQVETLEKLAEQAADPAGNVEQIETKFSSVIGHNNTAHTICSVLDVLIVALTVAFGVRALFLQPFQIPTGSMQPTLFGNHYIDRKEADPYLGPMAKMYLDVFGTRVTDPNGTEAARYRRPGEVVCDGWLTSGDHLFVDRMSQHFKDFERGEIFIFTTEGLKYKGSPLEGFFYIKRIAGMPGDTLKIVKNVLYVRPAGEAQFKPVYEVAPRMKKLYSGKGGYHGHLPVSPKDWGFLYEGMEYTVPEDHYFAMGDNSNNSLDSRYWGPVPRRNVIGRALNVFWPVSRRWGLIDTLVPLDTLTGSPRKDLPGSQMPSMRLQ